MTSTIPGRDRDALKWAAFRALFTAPENSIEQLHALSWWIAAEALECRMRGHQQGVRHAEGRVNALCSRLAAMRERDVRALRGAA